MRTIITMLLMASMLFCVSVSAAADEITLPEIGENAVAGQETGQQPAQPVNSETGSQENNDPQQSAENTNPDPQPAPAVTAQPVQPAPQTASAQAAPVPPSARPTVTAAPGSTPSSDTVAETAQPASRTALATQASAEPTPDAGQAPVETPGDGTDRYIRSAVILGLTLMLFVATALYIAGQSRGRRQGR